VAHFNGATNSGNWKKILVWQSGYEEMKSLVEELNPMFDVVIQTNGDQRTTLAKINFNREIGMRVAFENFGADFVLGIEEDAIISVDSLNFIENIYFRYRKSRKFMGINLGSIESKNEHHYSEYSKLRYGLQGQAGGLTDKAWATCSQLLRSYDKENVGWDSRIEFYLKTGFMVTPNVSRMIDLGWFNGAHAPSDPNHSHYKSLRDNWFNGESSFEVAYREKSIKHQWRKDVVVFRFTNSLVSCLRSYDKIRKLGVFIKRLFTKLSSDSHSN
jgi:hypothetical protein